MSKERGIKRENEDEELPRSSRRVSKFAKETMPFDEHASTRRTTSTLSSSSSSSSSEEEEEEDDDVDDDKEEGIGKSSTTNNILARSRSGNSDKERTGITTASSNVTTVTTTTTTTTTTSPSTPDIDSQNVPQNLSRLPPSSPVTTTRNSSSPSLGVAGTSLTSSSSPNSGLGRVKGPRSALTSFLEEQGIRPRGDLRTYQRSQTDAIANRIRENRSVMGGSDGSSNNTSTTTATNTFASTTTTTTSSISTAANRMPSETDGTVDEQDKERIENDSDAAETSATSGDSSPTFSMSSKRRNSVPNTHSNQDFQLLPKMKANLSKALSESSSKSTTSSSSSKKQLSHLNKKKQLNTNKNDSDQDAASSSSLRTPIIRQCLQCRCRITKANESLISEDICTRCALAAEENESASRKRIASSTKGRRVATKMNVLGRERFQVTSLQEMCLNLICKHIDGVESFGYIPHKYLHAICQIVCKHRKLNNDTLNLFLENDTEMVHLGDCSGVNEDGFCQIGSKSPGIHTLHLDCCGRLTDKALDYISQQCSNLKKVRLGGSFLLNDDMLASFLKEHRDLEVLEITWSGNLGLETISVITHPLQPFLNLKTLTLDQCVAVNDSMVSKLQSLKNLTSLSLSGCLEMTDLGIVPVLDAIGARLNVLHLAECIHLSEIAFVKIAECCANLTEVDFSFDTAGVTDASLISIVSSNRSLTKVDLRHCNQLTDEAIICLISSCPDISVLSLNAVHALTARAFSVMAGQSIPPPPASTALSSSSSHHDSNFTVQNSTLASIPLPSISKGLLKLQELDVSWCRCFDDDMLRALVQASGGLSKIVIWGCNRVTETVASSCSRKNFKIIGAPYEVVDV